MSDHNVSQQYSKQRRWPALNIAEREMLRVKTKQRYQNYFFQDGSKMDSIVMEDFLVVKSRIKMNFMN